MGHVTSLHGDDRQPQFVSDLERRPSSLVLAYGESFARQDWGVDAVRMAAHETQCPCGAGLVLRRQ